MKKILIIALCFITGCATKQLTTESNSNKYYPIGAENSKFLYAASNAFVNHKDLSKTNLINGQTYQTRLIEYSWGKKAETFYRVENGTVFYYDEKAATKNMIMPKMPVVGLKWMNSDNSWEYEIVSLDAELETPERSYTNLLVMRATQLKDRDETKLTEYYNYYEINTGKIASVGNGKLMTYRTY